MPKLLIATDLHLSALEKRYSFTVLDEIIEKAKNCDSLFLLGDTFNTFKDLEELKEEFSNRIETYGKSVYILKGNHEYLKSGGMVLSRLKFPSNVKIIENVDFFSVDDLDIAAFAYNEKYSVDSKLISDIESLKNKKRIFIGHGIVEGTLWAIEENEESAFIPIEIIKRVKPDLSIVGHIHKQMEINIENFNIIYPGSARVWRKSKSETGARKCLELNMENDSINKNYIKIESAGEYRIYDSNIGDMHSKIDIASRDWSINDVIEFNVYGIIEDENELESQIKEIINKYSKGVRELNIKKSNLFFLENARGESVIKEFLEIADEFEDSEITELAKRLGMERISLALQEKKNK